MQDYREHRRIGFHSKLLKLDWDEVNKSDNVNTVVSKLQQVCSVFRKRLAL